MRHESSSGNCSIKRNRFISFIFVIKLPNTCLLVKYRGINILFKFYGESLFNEFVTNQYDLAKEFEILIGNNPNFEIAAAPMSNILCFRYIDKSKSPEELNLLNATIRQVLLEDGEFYLVQTKLRGTHYLRTSLMNPFTTPKHLNQLLDKIVTVAHTIS